MPDVSQSQSVTTPAQVRRPRPFAWIFLGLLLGLLIAALSVRILLPSALQKFGFGAKTTLTDSTVVREIRSLQRLESVVYTLDQIVTTEHTYELLPPSLAGDRILLIVHGDVIAGIDLGQLQSQDVSVHDRSVTIKLPKAQIFTTRLDNQRTRVYSRDTGLFSTPDPQLESEARRHAEEQLTAAALQDGILGNATENAGNSITALLHSLGFAQVRIDSQ
ncbi:MAG: DUF4230 domain-containing protein [Acidobacteriaceae bacterium]